MSFDGLNVGCSGCKQQRDSNHDSWFQADSVTNLNLAEGNPHRSTVWPYSLSGHSTYLVNVNGLWFESGPALSSLVMPCLTL